MIPKAHIVHWRQHAPWHSDAQVEQDLVISRALVDLFSMPDVAENLAFRGGTALHKLYFSPPGRYSEDIDLVQVTPVPIGPVLNAVRSCLRPYLGEANRYVQKANMCTLTYRFASENVPPVPLRLKIEIMTREAFNVHGVTDRAFDVQSPWYSGATTLRTFRLEELLGTKLRALYQRRKGRDVFDLALALERSPSLDRQAIVDCFIAYMHRAGDVPTRAQLQANLDQKRAHQAFMNDMGTLLHPDYGDYDADTALDCVQRELIARLP